MEIKNLEPKDNSAENNNNENENEGERSGNNEHEKESENIKFDLEKFQCFPAIVELAYLMSYV